MFDNTMMMIMLTVGGGILLGLVYGAVTYMLDRGRNVHHYDMSISTCPCNNCNKTYMPIKQNETHQL